MNIIILTLPLHTNYGGVLQAFALQEVLKRMGHDVAILDCNRRISSFRKFLRKNKYKIISLLKRKRVDIFVEFQDILFYYWALAYFLSRKEEVYLRIAKEKLERITSKLP